MVVTPAADAATGSAADVDISVTGAAVVRPARRPRVVARPVVLSRAEEFRFIRSDLKRMLIISGVLLLAMVALLLLID